MATDKASIPRAIVITGAGGMLGSALANALATRGRNATALNHQQCDISSDADLARIFEHGPTLLLNCAAHTKVDLCEQEPQKADAINGYAVGKLAALCKSHGTCLVHVSTDFVFDGKTTRPYRTDDPVNPLSAYGRSKLLGEIELQRNAPSDWLIVRTAWVYGRGGGNFPRTIVTAAQAGKPLKVVADQVGAPTYAPDLAEAILDLLDKNARGFWNVTNSGQTTWLDFARATLEEFKIAKPIEPLTSAQWSQLRPGSAVRPAYSVLDISDTQKKIGREIRPWREGLRDFRAEVSGRGW